MGSPPEFYLQPDRNGKQLADRRYAENRCRTAETVSSRFGRACGNV